MTQRGRRRDAGWSFKRSEIVIKKSLRIVSESVPGGVPEKHLFCWTSRIPFKNPVVLDHVDDLGRVGLVANIGMGRLGYTLPLHFAVPCFPQVTGVSMREICRLASVMQTIALFFVVFCLDGSSPAAEVSEIGPGNRQPIAGKEVDWIDGDYVLRNDQIAVVVARPGALRDANMTVRGVGACIIDLSRLDHPSDQLSCYYPGAGRYQFFSDELVERGVTDEGEAFWRCTSSRSVVNDESVASVEYRLADGDPFVRVRFEIKKGTQEKAKPIDGVRADRTFAFEAIDELNVAYCEDKHFRQTYGFLNDLADSSPDWSKDRMRQLRYGSSGLEVLDGVSTWSTKIIPASSPLDLWGILSGGSPQRVVVQGAVGDQPRIELSLDGSDSPDAIVSTTWHVSDDGVSTVHLPQGNYRLKAKAIGHEATEVVLNVTESAAKHVVQLGSATSVKLKVTGQDGSDIPCKVTFFGKSDGSGNATTDPVFGIDSQSGSVGNCVYSADGTIHRSIPPGVYDVLISRGPEYDVEYREIDLKAGQMGDLSATLKRVVDTTGWVSAELHSHSSPSGDNTSDQLGRVENLICEHLEFAPCTEHQRIESYDDQLAILGAERFMATCTGMELTGSILPINHQNAFPLNWSPYAQDGGGPRTDNQDPVNQIARLAMWDDGSKKVVQTNHPNMQQMLRDRNLDGEEDGGFSGMLEFMDVIEIHPPEMIFLDAEETAELKNPNTNRMLPWMNLIGSGKRIPGVVNTDAHYNWHGSGSLRNWIRCSTDIPAKISTDEMTERLEAGQVIMSTGPFMSVQLKHPDLTVAAEVGDAVEIATGDASLDVKIQCANWLDVNRVEVFVNGISRPSLTRTRSENPESFGQGVIKFEQSLPLKLSDDSFVIVAAIGERLQLGRVMGAKEGKRQPVVVSNPIYVSLND